MSSAELDLLEAVFDETEATLAGVKPDQLGLPTPCRDFDVARLVDHLTGWADSFAARLAGQTPAGDPNDYHAGADPAAEFHDAARTIVGAYRAGAEQAKALPVGVLLMEFLVHGWDLAAATGQPVNLPPAAADLALEAGRQLLKPDYRGPGKPFDFEVEVPETASSVDRVVAFLGRSPDWRPAPE